MSEVLSQDEIEELLSTDYQKTKIERYFLKLKKYFKKYIARRREKINRISGKYPMEPVNTFFGLGKLNYSLESFQDIELLPPETKYDFTIFKIRNTDFVLSRYECPKCKGKLEMSEDEYSRVPTLKTLDSRKRKMVFRNMRRYRCPECGKKFTSEIKYLNEIITDLGPVKTIQLLNEWYWENHHYLTSLFSMDDGTCGIQNGRILLFWDKFLSDDVSGLFTCPEHLLVAIIHNSSMQDLNRMIRGEKGIAVFDGFRFEI